MVLRVKVGNEGWFADGVPRWLLVGSRACIETRCDSDCTRRHGNLKILWFVVA
jgi:hypothetical protein